MEHCDMDIERFAPNTGATLASVVTTLPTTIEMTGFSDRRHYLEQHAVLNSDGRRTRKSHDLDIPALDSQLLS